MRFVWGRLGLTALVAFGAMGVDCFEETPEQRARAVAGAYCECFVTSGQVDECISEVMADLPPVSDECLDCVVSFSQTCSALDAQCTDLCLDNSQP